jgi:copper ion binding protein
MYELQVGGMSCNHCVNAVTKSVKSVDPQAKVDVNLDTQNVRIDSSANLNIIADAIIEAGYPVIRSSTV